MGNFIDRPVVVRVPGALVMYKKWFLSISLVFLMMTLEYTYYRYQEYHRLKHLEHQYQQIQKQTHLNSIGHFDGSELIHQVMTHAKSNQLLVVRVEPKTHRMFHIVLEGQYRFFVHWISIMNQEVPDIHWQKIIIRKISLSQQRFFLIGVQHV